MVLKIPTMLAIAIVIPKVAGPAAINPVCTTPVNARPAPLPASPTYFAAALIPEAAHSDVPGIYAGFPELSTSTPCSAASTIAAFPELVAAFDVTCAAAVAGSIAPKLGQHACILIRPVEAPGHSVQHHLNIVARAAGVLVLNDHERLRVRLRERMRLAQKKTVGGGRP